MASIYGLSYMLEPPEIFKYKKNGTALYSVLYFIISPS